MPVTVVVPTRDEAASLPRCLASLGHDFTEVVVVDSGSRDGTQEIARASGATVLEFRWNGALPKKRNWTLGTHRFAAPWVLFLDADERVTPAFVAELRRVLPHSPHAGYWIAFDNWFLGAPLRHGDVMRKLALFRVGAGAYEPVDHPIPGAPDELDMEVHEHPVLTGSVGRIRARLEHDDRRGLASYLAKHESYAAWEAQRFLHLANAPSEAWDRLTWRQRVKYRHLDAWWLSWAYVAAAYFAKGGFLDGRAGLRFHLHKRRYFADIRRRIVATRRDQRP
ncbi:MAG: glycosyltransferase family 2 protein [Sandaracinaceae bacterium]